jgi:hypothetical protein
MCRTPAAELLSSVKSRVLIDPQGPKDHHDRQNGQNHQEFPALEARTAVGEALTELQLLTDEPRVLELAARVIDITYLHEAPDRDRRTDVARAAHNAFVAAAGPLVWA